MGQKPHTVLFAGSYYKKDANASQNEVVKNFVQKSRGLAYFYKLLLQYFIIIFTLGSLYLFFNSFPRIVW